MWIRLKGNVKWQPDSPLGTVGGSSHSSLYCTFLMLKNEPCSNFFLLSDCHLTALTRNKFVLNHNWNCCDLTFALPHNPHSTNCICFIKKNFLNQNVEPSSSTSTSLSPILIMMHSGSTHTWIHFRFSEQILCCFYIFILTMSIILHVLCFELMWG